MHHRYYSRQIDEAEVSGGIQTNHASEQVAEVLLFSWETGVCFYANEKASLKVGERVQVKKEIMNLVLRDDIVRLDLSLIILTKQSKVRQKGQRTVPSSPSANHSYTTLSRDKE